MTMAEASTWNWSGLKGEFMRVGARM